MGRAWQDLSSSDPGCLSFADAPQEPAGEGGRGSTEGAQPCPVSFYKQEFGVRGKKFPREGWSS